MSQKYKLAASVINYWMVYDRAMKLGAIKKGVSREKFEERMKGVLKADEEKLGALDEHFCKTVLLLLYKEAEGGNQAKGVLPYLVPKLGGIIQNKSKAKLATVAFKLQTTSLNTFQDLSAALSGPTQLPEIIEFINSFPAPTLIDGATPAFAIEINYGINDWYVNVDRTLTEVEKLSEQTQRLNKILTWYLKLPQAERNAVEAHHIFLNIEKINFDKPEVEIVYSTTETPAGIKQRELKARLEEALRQRTKRVSDIKIEKEAITIETEAEPIKLELDVITHW